MKSAYNLKYKNMTQTAMIAAVYVILTFISSSFGLAYLGIQFRLSEILTILPIFTPNAVLGLTIGCFISNMFSPLGVIDLILGTLSTLIAALLTRALRKVEYKNFPILAPLPPVLMTAIFVSFLVLFASAKEIYLAEFLTLFVSLGISEFFSCYILGGSLIIFLKKVNIFKNT